MNEDKVYPPGFRRFTGNDLYRAVVAAKEVPGLRMDKAEEAKHLRAAADKVEAEIAAEAAEKEAKVKREAFVAQVRAEKLLVEVGVIMLGDIAKLIAGEASHAVPQTAYATHRQGLSELARKYGYKLVLVGDRTKAALVQR